MSLAELYLEANKPADDPAALLLTFRGTAGMIVIRNLRITATWTDSDQQRLSSGAVSIGPFLVTGAKFNGQTLKRDGMQVTAWICQVPRLLPPAQ